jgi:hypothetical protein
MPAAPTHLGRLAGKSKFSSVPDVWNFLHEKVGEEL